jgi:hypothetical protein
MAEARSIDTKEAAQMLRVELKRRWPRIRFSVRFARYSMGSHINVSWTDGPAKRAVEEVACAYSSSRFDGMSDSTYYVRSWLLADGRAMVAIHGDVDGGSRGTLTEAPEPGAELVVFYGSAPHCEREFSPAYQAACDKAWAGLSAVEQSCLRRTEHFPQWDGFSDGYKLASFFDAAKILKG